MNKKISKILFIMFAIIIISTNSYAEWFVAPEVYEKENFFNKIIIQIQIIIFMLIIRLFIKHLNNVIKENNTSKNIIKIYTIFIIIIYISLIMLILDIIYPTLSVTLIIKCLIISGVIAILFPIIIFIRIRKDKENDLWNYIKYWSMISFLFLFQIYLILEFEIKNSIMQTIVLILALMYLFFYIKLKPKVTKEIDEYKKYVKFKICSTLLCFLVVVRYTSFSLFTLFESLFGLLFGSFNLVIVVIAVIVVGIIYVLYE